MKSVIVIPSARKIIFLSLILLFLSFSIVIVSLITSNWLIVSITWLPLGTYNYHIGLLSNTTCTNGNCTTHLGQTIGDVNRAGWVVFSLLLFCVFLSILSIFFCILRVFNRVC